ncbi:hypothetical protein [Natronorubrum halophilum]|uniref:hypothetical protein n=1 Tax=Natronorubrum halophilum TaxID=1702106 RepID=UPI0010C15DFC|nr:hypothetical protein [Natronorubrum halophilum]
MIEEGRIRPFYRDGIVDAIAEMVQEAGGDRNVVSFTGMLSSAFGTGAVALGFGLFLNNSVSQLGETGLVHCVDTIRPSRPA